MRTRSQVSTTVALIFRHQVDRKNLYRRSRRDNNRSDRSYRRRIDGQRRSSTSARSFFRLHIDVPVSERRRSFRREMLRTEGTVLMRFFLLLSAYETEQTWRRSGCGSGGDKMESEEECW